MLEELYTELASRGLVRSRREFSVEWLGETQNYLARRSRNRCSSDALIHLIKRLRAAREAKLADQVMGILFANDRTIRRK